MLNEIFLLLSSIDSFAVAAGHIQQTHNTYKFSRVSIRKLERKKMEFKLDHGWNKNSNFFCIRCLFGRKKMEKM